MNSLNKAYLPESLSLSNQQGLSNETFLGLLDSHFPLNEGSHREVTQYRVYFDCLLAHLKSGRCVGLSRPSEFQEFGGDRECPSSIILKNDDQQIELIL
jgi:malate synthase